VEELTVPEVDDRPDDVVELLELELEAEVEDVAVAEDVEPGTVAALT
jgi:hypothetical protein